MKPNAVLPASAILVLVILVAALSWKVPQASLGDAGARVEERTIAQDLDLPTESMALNARDPSGSTRTELASSQLPSISVASGGSAYVRVHVFDQVTLAPVLARITLRREHESGSSPIIRFVNGRHQFELVDESRDSRLSLRAEADGYDPKDVAILAASLDGEVQVGLDPAGEVRVQVVDGLGHAVAGVEVVTSALGVLGERGDRRLGEMHQRTDREGVASFKTSCAVKAWIRERPLVTTLAQPGGALVVLAMPRRSTSLRFLDARSGDPQPYLEVAISGPFAPGYGPRTLWTDVDGLLELSGAKYPLKVQFMDRSVVAAESQGDSLLNIVAAEVDPRELVLTREAVDSVIDVNLDRLGPLVLCQDGTSENELEGTAQFRVEHLESEVVIWEGTWVDATLRRGIFALPPIGFQRRPMQVSVRVAGRAPRVVSADDYARAMEESPSLIHLSFPPATGELNLTLRAEGGQPWKAPVIICGQRNSDVVWEGLPNDSGEVPGILREHGELRILNGGMAGATQWQPSGLPLELGRVSAAQVRAGGDVLVIIPQGLGSLSVRNIPTQVSAIAARHESGAMFLPHLMEDGAEHHLLFESLPEGRYLLGPVEWIESIWVRLFSEPILGWVEVSVGQDTQTPWDNRWRSVEEIKGRVIFPPGFKGETTLVPAYGDFEGRPLAGVRQRAIPVDSTGGYVIPAGSPVPTLVILLAGTDAVARRVGSQSSVQYLAAFSPGGVHSLPYGHVQFTWEETAREDVAASTRMLSFSLPGTRLGLAPAPGGKTSGAQSVSYACEGTRGIVAALVPSGRCEVVFTNGSTQFSRVIDVEAGEAREYEVPWEGVEDDEGK